MVTQDPIESRLLGQVEEADIHIHREKEPADVFSGHMDARIEG
jgi:hypothetical protein